MILYRNVGKIELMKALIIGDTIMGQYTRTGSNTCKLSKAFICAYAEEFEWRDRSNHCFRLILDIDPNSRDFQIGVGTYHMTEYSAKNNRWSGRTGGVYLAIKEAYFYFYSYKDISEIILYKKYNRLRPDFIEEIKTACYTRKIDLCLE